MTKKLETKIKPLTPKFFNDIANKIYNPKTKKFLRLCAGSLTNGPDPTDKKRKMHCGLGELYFEMTGEHTGKLTEEDIFDLVIENLSPMPPVLSQIKKLKSCISECDEIISNEFNSTLEEFNDNLCDNLPGKEKSIYNALNDIPDVNDEADNFCEVDDDGYLIRSKDVSNKFREIAKALATFKPLKKSAKKSTKKPVKKVKKR